MDELLEYLTGNMEYMRAFVKEKFPKAHFVESEGTYLTWVDFSGYGFTDEELEYLMVEEAKLWLDCGKVFGPETAQFERFQHRVSAGYGREGYGTAESRVGRACQLEIMELPWERWRLWHRWPLV